MQEGSGADHLSPKASAVWLIGCRSVSLFSAPRNTIKIALLTAVSQDNVDISSVQSHVVDCAKHLSRRVNTSASLVSPEAALYCYERK
jgi:hypothetical protein